MDVWQIPPSARTEDPQCQDIQDQVSSILFGDTMVPSIE